MSDIQQSEQSVFALKRIASVDTVSGVFSVIEKRTTIFSDRQEMFGEDTPDWLIGKSFVKSSDGRGMAVAVTGGYIYILVFPGDNDAAEAYFTKQGFCEVARVAGSFLNRDIGQEAVLLEKQVESGDRIALQWRRILIAGPDERYMNIGGSIPPDMALKVPRIIKNPLAEEYRDGNRKWQGIPGIECTPGGRLWATWYSGSRGEDEYNWVLLYTSGDSGQTWSGPAVAIDPAGYVRAFDPVLWTDPHGRLWVFWNQSYHIYDGRAGVWAMYTGNPEDENPDWSTPVRIANGVAMNKPVVLADGDWLLPVSVWRNLSAMFNMGIETGANVYLSNNDGDNWRYFGGVKNYEHPAEYEENMVIELLDGSLRMYIRTTGGIETATSCDGGVTWSNSIDAGLSRTVSRFHVRRLSSGNLLLVYHGKGSDSKRSYLTAALSEDDGATWPYELLLDKRDKVSYPDSAEDQNGNIHIVYDRERHGAMEILMAVVTEADIRAGEIVTKGSRLKVLINNNNKNQS